MTTRKKGGGTPGLNGQRVDGNSPLVRQSRVNWGRRNPGRRQTRKRALSSEKQDDGRFSSSEDPYKIAFPRWCQNGPLITMRTAACCPREPPQSGNSFPRDTARGACANIWRYLVGVAGRRDARWEASSMRLQF